jgi:Protein of unknown function (DUF3224)
MSKLACAGISVIIIVGFCIASAMQAPKPIPNAIQKGPAMAGHASGTFEVKLNPQPPEDKTEGSTLGRMLIDKHFQGDLEASSKGQMLTAMTEVKGSAGYVAMERVTGTLKGRSGSFVLQHSGTLTSSASQQSITVVPDSGSGQLVGLAGKMTITIADGKHSYDFEYTLPRAPDQ